MSFFQKDKKNGGVTFRLLGFACALYRDRTGYFEISTPAPEGTNEPAPEPVPATEHNAVTFVRNYRTAPSSFGKPADAPNVVSFTTPENETIMVDLKTGQEVDPPKPEIKFEFTASPLTAVPKSNLPAVPAFRFTTPEGKTISLPLSEEECPTIHMSDVLQTRGQVQTPPLTKKKKKPSLKKKTEAKAKAKTTKRKS